MKGKNSLLFAIPAVMVLIFALAVPATSYIVDRVDGILEPEQPAPSTETISHTVINDPPVVTNRPPVVTIAPATGIADEAAYRSSLTVEDPEGDTVHIQLESAPQGFSLTQDGNRAELAWELHRDDQGVFDIEISISDGELSTAYKFSIFVPPVIVKELIQNGDASRGMDGWQIIASGGDGWTVEGTHGQSSFVTSYEMCRKRQVINLRAMNIDPQMLKGAELIVSDSYCRRDDCPSEYYLTVQLMDEHNNVIDSFSVNEEAKSTEFETVQKKFTSISRLASISFEHGGKDRKWWAGHYGARMTGASVRLRSRSLPSSKQLVTIPQIRPRKALFSASGDSLMVVSDAQDEALIFSTADWSVRKITVPPAHSWAFSPDGSRIACSTRTSISVMDVNTGRSLYTISKESDIINDLEFSPDGALLAGYSSSNRTLYLWKGRETLRSTSFKSTLSGVRFTPDSQSIFALDSGKMTLHPVRGNGAPASFKGHLFSIKDSVVLPELNRLYTVASDMMVGEWDLKKKTLLRTFTGHESPANAIHTLPDGKLLSSDAEIVIIWDPATGSPIARHEFPGNRGIACSPQKRKIAVLHDTHIAVHSFDLATGRLLTRPLITDH